jgi:hypothetical protein
MHKSMSKLKVAGDTIWERNSKGFFCYTGIFKPSPTKKFWNPLKTDIAVLENLWSGTHTRISEILLSYKPFNVKKNSPFSFISSTLYFILHLFNSSVLGIYTLIKLLCLRFKSTSSFLSNTSTLRNVKSLLFFKFYSLFLL